MKQSKERGAIVIEATLSLTAFVFVLYTLLMIVNIYYIQARISVALNTATKELSEYCYLYYKAGLGQVDAELGEGTDEGRDEAKKTIDGLSAMNESISGAKDSLNGLDFEGLKENINNGVDAGSGLYDQYSEKFSSDPAGFIGGLATAGIDDLAEAGKAALASIMGRAFMEKNLVAYDGDDTDMFLRRYKVVDGLDGLDFAYSQFLPGGKDGHIQLVVSYDVKVIDFFGWDFKFHFQQAAMSEAWALGISKIHPETNVNKTKDFWDGSPAANAFLRNYALANEPYLGNGTDFDGYDPDTNRFSTVVVANYPDEISAEELKALIIAEYQAMMDRVNGLENPILMYDHNGNPVEIESDSDSRKGKMLIVYPKDKEDYAFRQMWEEIKQEYPEMKLLHKWVREANFSSDGD